MYMLSSGKYEYVLQIQFVLYDFAGRTEDNDNEGTYLLWLKNFS